MPGSPESHRARVSPRPVHTNIRGGGGSHSFIHIQVSENTPSIYIKTLHTVQIIFCLFSVSSIYVQEMFLYEHVENAVNVYRAFMSLASF